MPVGQVIADIVNGKRTIVELDLPKNTKSSKKYKIKIETSAGEVGKAKTTVNNIVHVLPRRSDAP